MNRGSRMKKRIFLIVVWTVLTAGLLAACGRNETVTMQNTVSTFYGGQGLVEATVRELAVQNRKAQARILFTNVSGNTMDSIHAEIHYLDEMGQLLDTQPFTVQYETPLENGSSHTYQSYYEGKNARKITRVVITEANGE